MAKAETVTQVTEYVLRLSQKEAQTLRNILGAVGGDPRTTDRVYADNIAGALENVGIVFDYRDVEDLFKGSIMFTADPPF